MHGATHVVSTTDAGTVEAGSNAMRGLCSSASEDACRRAHGSYLNIPGNKEVWNRVPTCLSFYSEQILHAPEEQ